MVKSHIICGLMGLLAGGVSAQPAKEPVAMLKVAANESAPAVDVQQRRAALRAMLKSQHDGTAMREMPSLAERQLSAQERADLRQQLRKQ
ncbi:MAG: hypothetical protein V4858_07685 [Pseudomonadota bacterium]